MQDCVQKVLRFERLPRLHQQIHAQLVALENVVQDLDELVLVAQLALLLHLVHLHIAEEGQLVLIHLHFLLKL